MASLFMLLALCLLCGVRLNDAYNNITAVLRPNPFYWRPNSPNPADFGNHLQLPSFYGPLDPAYALDRSVFSYYFDHTAFSYADYITFAEQYSNSTILTVIGNNYTEPLYQCLTSRECSTFGSLPSCLGALPAQGLCDTSDFTSFPGAGPIYSGVGNIGSTCTRDADCPSTAQFCRTVIDITVLFFYNNRYFQTYVEQYAGGTTAHRVYHKDCVTDPAPVCATDYDCPAKHKCVQWISLDPNQDVVLNSDCQFDTAYLPANSIPECVDDWQCSTQPGTSCQTSPQIGCNYAGLDTCPQNCISLKDGTITREAVEFIPDPNVASTDVCYTIGYSDFIYQPNNGISALDVFDSIAQAFSDADPIPPSFNKVGLGALDLASLGIGVGGLVGRFTKILATGEIPVLGEIATLYDVLSVEFALLDLAIGVIKSILSPFFSKGQVYYALTAVADRANQTYVNGDPAMCPVAVQSLTPQQPCLVCMPANYTVNYSTIAQVQDAAQYTTPCKTNQDCAGVGLREFDSSGIYLVVVQPWPVCGVNLMSGCSPNGNPFQPSCRYSMNDMVPFWVPYMDTKPSNCSAIDYLVKACGVNQLPCDEYTYTTGHCGVLAPFWYGLSYFRAHFSNWANIESDINSNGSPNQGYPRTDLPPIPVGGPFGYVPPPSTNITARATCQAVQGSLSDGNNDMLVTRFLTPVPDYTLWREIVAQYQTLGIVPANLLQSTQPDPSQASFTIAMFKHFGYLNMLQNQVTVNGQTEYCSCAPGWNCMPLPTAWPAGGTRLVCYPGSPMRSLCANMGTPTLHPETLSWTCACDSTPLVNHPNVPVSVPTPDQMSCVENCEATICNSNGLCTFYVDTYPGYSTNLSDPRSSERSDPCVCNPGWGGRQCNIPDADAGCCNDNGVYGPIDPSCELPPYNCSNFGVLRNLCSNQLVANASYPALCYDFSQPEAEFICYGMNDQQSALTAPTRHCTCQPGYYGAQCALSQAECDATVCMGNGQCQTDPVANDIECVCYANWTSYPPYQIGKPYRWTLDPADYLAPNRQCTFPVPLAVLDHDTGLYITDPSILKSMPCGPNGYPALDPGKPNRFVYFDSNGSDIYRVDSDGRNYAEYSSLFTGGLCQCNSTLLVNQDPASTYCGTISSVWNTVSAYDPQVNLAGLGSVCGQPFRGHSVDSKDGYSSTECLCYNGFNGPDCSQVNCPVNQYGDPCSGPSNLDYSTTPPTIVGRGYCDASTNRCICNSQYVGIACELNQQDCNGRGQVRNHIEL